jgi:hypothetical protein
VTDSLRWVFLGFAGAAAAVGIWAGPNYGVAVPAALVAVGLGGLAFWESSRQEGRPVTAPTPAYDGGPVGVRSWFVEGTLGREEIILLLDRLDREGPNPYLPARPPAELRRLVELPTDTFRKYVQARLDQVEGPSP